MRRLSAIAVCLVALSLAGCGDEFMTTDMSSAANAQGYTLTVAATPDNLNILGGGSITITVQVLDPAGDGVSGAAVNVSATLGTLAETALTTDADGFAATTLTAGTVTGYAIVVGTYKGVQAMVKCELWSGSAEQ
jgi:hypothetical protein